MATTAELVHREYWTPDEAARVLGRSSGFWRNAFDTQLVTGYRDGVVAAHDDGIVSREEASSIRAMGEATIAAIYAEIENAERSAGTARVSKLRDAS